MWDLERYLIYEYKKFSDSSILVWKQFLWPNAIHFTNKMQVCLPEESLRENIGAFVNALLRAKPAGLKKGGNSMFSLRKMGKKKETGRKFFDLLRPSFQDMDFVHLDHSRFLWSHSSPLIADSFSALLYMCMFCDKTYLNVLAISSGALCGGGR